MIRAKLEAQEARMKAAEKGLAAEMDKDEGDWGEDVRVPVRVRVSARWR